MRTNFPKENGESATATKDPQNISGQLESEQNVKYPKRLRYHGKGKVLATIYERPDGERGSGMVRHQAGKVREEHHPAGRRLAQTGAMTPDDELTPITLGVMVSADDTQLRLPRN